MDLTFQVPMQYCSSHHQILFAIRLVSSVYLRLLILPQASWLWLVIHGLVQNWERSISRVYIVTMLILILCRVHHAKTPLSMEFSRQEYWSGVPLPSPGHLPNPGLLHYRQIVYHLSHHGCERWTIKKSECWRIYAFELWCWRKLLRVLWTARRSSQLILKEINPEYSVEGLMLKLKLPYFGHLMERADSLEKTQCWENWRQEKGTTDD